MSHIKVSEYPFTIRHLSNEEGSGFLIEYPDLPGCMSDGDTIEGAIENGQDAIHAWIEAAKDMDKPIPVPGELEGQSGKWVQRVPKSIHLRLVNKAREEGISLNTLVISMLAESLSYENINRNSYKNKVREPSENFKKLNEKIIVTQEKHIDTMSIVIEKNLDKHGYVDYKFTCNVFVKDPRYKSRNIHISETSGLFRISKNNLESELLIPAEGDKNNISFSKAALKVLKEYKLTNVFPEKVHYARG